MILLGLIIFLGSIAWIALVIMAAASHPTGNMPGGSGPFVLGIAGAVIGFVMMAAGIAMWVLLLFGPSEAAADEIACGPAEPLKRHLVEQLEQRPVGGGLGSETLLVTVFASPGGKTFSIVLFNTHGFACLLATGTDWEPGTNPVAAIEEQNG